MHNKSYYELKWTNAFRVSLETGPLQPNGDRYVHIKWHSRNGRCEYMWIVARVKPIIIQKILKSTGVDFELYLALQETILGNAAALIAALEFDNETD